MHACMPYYNPGSRSTVGVAAWGSSACTGARTPAAAQRATKKFSMARACTRARGVQCGAVQGMAGWRGCGVAGAQCTALLGAGAGAIQHTAAPGGAGGGGGAHVGLLAPHAP